MSAKICDFVAYRAAHPGSAVRVQVHYAPLWPLQFWMAFWGEGVRLTIDSASCFLYNAGLVLAMS